MSSSSICNCLPLRNGSQNCHVWITANNTDFVLQQLLYPHFSFAFLPSPPPFLPPSLSLPSLSLPPLSPSLPPSLGHFCSGEPRFVPATPLGVLEIIKRLRVPTFGKNVCIANRSKNIGQLLVYRTLVSCWYSEHWSVTGIWNIGLLLVYRTLVSCWYMEHWSVRTSVSCWYMEHWSVAGIQNIGQLLVFRTVVSCWYTEHWSVAGVWNSGQLLVFRTLVCCWYMEHWSVAGIQNIGQLLVYDIGQLLVFM